MDTKGPVENATRHEEVSSTSSAMSKTTTISTIAVQSGKTRIVIALLHVSFWELRLFLGKRTIYARQSLLQKISGELTDHGLNIQCMSITSCARSSYLLIMKFINNHSDMPIFIPKKYILTNINIACVQPLV
ncbi:hypothetical protein JTB14_030241 [Gonioctena quinquepunctata]|nr:hypothetical protein JTB14_030241 [Gonioctena quinquepunctata]